MSPNLINPPPNLSLFLSLFLSLLSTPILCFSHCIICIKEHKEDHLSLFSLSLSGTNKQDMPIWTPRSVNVPLNEDHIQGLLKRYDKNGDGKLSKKELKNAFRDLGLKFCGWRAGRALRHADANGDGYISDEELNELVKYAKRWGFSLY